MNRAMLVSVMLAGLSGASFVMGFATMNELNRDPARLRACRAADGDSMSCENSDGRRERIRLNGIDAPETGPCPAGRRCVVGDPDWSRWMLEVGMDKGRMSIERHAVDRFGRTIATVRAGDVDLSCWQLENRTAIYRPDWDEGRRVVRKCRP